MTGKFPRTRPRCRAAAARLDARPRLAGECLPWLRLKAVRAIPPLVIVVVVVAWCLAVLHAAAYADPGPLVPHVAAPSVDTVINRLRAWLIGILAALATLFLTIGGVRYVIADGDPGQVEKAKSALTSAALGYALAALAPVLLTVVKGLVK